MAKKSEAKREEKNTGIPEGFIPVNAAGGGAWFQPDLGEAVLGELLGRFRKKKSLSKDKEAWFYQIMLEKPCPAKKKVDDESVEVNLEPGDLINIDERAALEDLASLPDSGKRWRLFIQPLDKVPIPGTAQTVWRFNVGKQEIIPGKNEPKVKLKGAAGAEDIPF